MDTEKINNIINKTPITLLLGMYLLYLSYDYYNFMYGSDSPISSKTSEIQNQNNQTNLLIKKKKELEQFSKTLDSKKIEIRGLAQELETEKAVLPEKLDIPKIIKMFITEAKKVGLTVSSISPDASATKEYYTEQSFKLNFRGVYAQILVFLERLSNVSEIVRIENISVKSTDVSGEYTELTGSMEIKMFKYVGSTTDQIEAKPTETKVDQK